jgi:parallel beta-helix repeat protein
MSSYTVKNKNDSGFGSLREGINYSNINPNSTIIFDPEANGEIELKSCLPRICKTTKIIGNLDLNNIPLNTINGKHKYRILQLYKTKNCIIKNLCLIGSSGSGLYIHKSNSNEIDNCWIGINDKNEKVSNEYGIVINKSKYNKIGSNPESIQEYFSNTISGNNKYGIFIIDSKSNSIINNIIGLSSLCTNVIENFIGIFLKNSKYNTIGGKKFIDNN